MNVKRSILAFVCICICSCLLFGGVKPNPDKKFRLTVVNGSGGGDYPVATEVMVTASEDPAGEDFSHWVAEGMVLTDEQARSNPLTIIMPEGNVTLTAQYGGKIQTLSLLAGWNWVGFYILPESHKVGDVLPRNYFTANDQIQTSSGMSRFTGAEWLPSSFTVDYGILYQIYTAHESTLTISGQGHGSTGVPVIAGWNWIANPTERSVSPSELRHSSGFTPGDRIQGISGTVTYSGSKWLPSTGFSLALGKGYQLYTAKGGTLMFNDEPTAYAVSVTNGTADKATARPGETVTITADAPGEHQFFAEWDSDDVVFTDATAMTTTFTMPAKNVSVTATYTDEQKYTITVSSGSASKTSAYAGETITITANAPAAHKVFSKWTTSSGVAFASATSSTTTFTMPAKNVSVTATYVDEQKYTITVSSGSASKTSAYAGETITITANAPAAHKVFSKWTTTSGVTFASATSSTTTFTMPAKNVSVTATYADEQKYTITVSSGSASMTSAYAGETITITANAPAAHKVFSKWTTMSGVTFASATSMTTTFTMPAKNVSVTATYADEPKYTITVKSGSASKTSAYAGETITITANTPAADKVFDRWNGDVVFASATSSTTTFTMPERNVVVTASYSVADDTLYAIVDLSGGANATSYPVRYSRTGPDLSDDTCRTTELWLRKIPAGTFTMGSPTGEAGHQSNETPHTVTLTSDYYIGVFECTQEQWKLVMGIRPSFFSNDSCYATRPVEYVSFVDIRGSSSGVGWPENGHAVDATSFMGKLRARTGVMFDLPTEALWEYACRAGTETALNTGRNLTNPSGADAAMAEAGRYRHNGGSGYTSACTDEYGTAKVGSYLPNAWGLYDMHGNVSEWCLDRFGEYGSETTDPVGAETGTSRVKRGGDWNIGASQSCRSASRQKEIQTKKVNSIGFRITFQP